MTCDTCDEIPYSQLGKVYTGRSVPGHPGTIRGEPVWKEYESKPMNGWRAPPNPESLTPQQQIYKHMAIIPGPTPVQPPTTQACPGRINKNKNDLKR